MTSTFEKECVDTMDMIESIDGHGYNWNFMRDFKNALKNINDYLENSIYKQRIMHIMLNIKQMTGISKRMEILHLYPNCGIYPCLSYPNKEIQANHRNNRYEPEPSYISLKDIGSFIKQYRLGDKKEEIREKMLNEKLLPIISCINDYPFDFIEIVETKKPLIFNKISLINQRPSLITISFIKSTDIMGLDENYTIDAFWVFGEYYNISCNEHNAFCSIIPSPHCLFKLFNAGVDIIHFYDKHNQIMITDNYTKYILMNKFYSINKTIYNMIIPFFLVSCKYQEPFIAAYNYLNQQTDIMSLDGIIRIIISFAYNEFKFEDISYIQFDDKDHIKNVEDIKDNEEEEEDEEEERRKQQNNMNIICNHCLLRLPSMLKEWRNWMIKQICLQFNDQQCEYLKVHMKRHKNDWFELIEKLEILDGENWIFLASKFSECGFDISSKRIVTAIKVFASRSNISDFQLLLEKYNMKFNNVEVWINHKVIGDYQLGLFWYFICNINVNDNDKDKKIWNALIAHLRKLYKLNPTEWYKLCIECFLCDVFFKFYGSLQNQRKLQCMENTIKLLKMWKDNLLEQSKVSDIQSLYLIQCFDSCNIEIFNTFIHENILNVNMMKDDDNKDLKQNGIYICIYNLFEAFKSKCPLIQIRRYNQMVIICKWLYKNGCHDYLTMICQDLIKQIDIKWTETKEQKWKNVIRKLNSLQTDWTAVS